MDNLAVIVVAYHHADLLDRCLKPLPRHVPVWVIDNSSDPEVEAVAAARNATYVDTGENLGFAAGVNTGLRLVPPASDVLLLNPDAVVADDALEALHRYLRAPGNQHLAAVSPSLVDPRRGSRQRVRWPLPTPGRMWREALGISRLIPPPDEFCIGAVLLLRRQAIEDVGLFDERFFLYAEEADWQRRALNRGWAVAELERVAAEHIGAGTSTNDQRRQALFHAGQETYIRKWFGSLGWLSYRAAAVLGAALRACGPNRQGRAYAAERLLLYFRSPRRVVSLDRRDTTVGRRVAHIVVTTAFAGVERYVCEVGREQARLGSHVTVIGGDPTRMRAELGNADFLPASNVRGAIRQLRRCGRQDIVHAHMTAAELVAVATSPWHRGRIISTRHFAARRGSSAGGRTLRPIVRRVISRQVAISHFVSTAVGEPADVVPNGVQDRRAITTSRQKVVLCLQRLEPEKAPALALHAWALSGLGRDGWELHVAGTGSLRDELMTLAEDLGVAPSVRWLGQVRDTQERLMRAGVLFSTATAEPFGLSVAEAMALGTPVVASDGGAHGELLGIEGWVFPVGDAAEAAGQLRRAASSKSEELREYGSYLQERQRRLFSIDDHVAKLNAIYRSASISR